VGAIRNTLFVPHLFMVTGCDLFLIQLPHLFWLNKVFCFAHLREQQHP